MWFTNGENIGNTPNDAGFAIAEVEGDADVAGIRSVQKSGRLPACPLGIVTNHGGLIVKDGPVTDIEASMRRAAPLVDAGFACLNEVYLRADNGAPTGKTPEEMEFIAREHLGFGVVQDVYGIFGGATLGDYAPWMKSRTGWSLYLAEHVL